MTVGKEAAWWRLMVVTRDSCQKTCRRSWMIERRPPGVAVGGYTISASMVFCPFYLCKLIEIFVKTCPKLDPFSSGKG